MSQIEISNLKHLIVHDLILNYLSFFWELIFHNHLCYFEIWYSHPATSDRWIDISERIHTDRSFYKYRMLMFFENLKTFYLSNLLEEYSHHKISSRLSNVETQFKECEISYSLLLASNVYMLSRHWHVYSNHRILDSDRRIFFLR